MSGAASEHQRLTDEDLIRAFQDGDETAFTVLVGRFKHPLINFVYRFLGDYDEADDVVQETFLRLYRNKQSYQPVAKFSTWLYTIATNLAKTQLRKRKRRALFSIQRRAGEGQAYGGGSQGFEGVSMDIPDTRYPADQEAERSLQARRIQEALESISPKYREVIVLCDIQELSYEEIASVTGLNIGTVKSRINRGRLQLQKLLRDLME
jgi:RNA polymerase sigma-70 factor (ECF subfamily)